MRVRAMFFLLALSLPFSGSFSQIPAGYYDPAIGLTGTFLQQALHDIIKDHTVKSYSYLWTAFQSTDAKPNGTVWDMYSDIPDGTPNGNPPYVFQFITDQCGTASQEGDCYSREHSFPKAWFGGEVTPMYTDLFHIYPVDQFVNNRHSDNPMGEITTPTWTSLNGSKVGPCTTEGYTGTVFEPRDEYKGDIARSYFYMAVRYYTEDGGWPGSDMVSGSQPFPWALEMLIRWHQSDPVSAKEIARNNVIYTIQHNRNPFIDHPEYVAAIWSSAPIKPEPTNHATNFQSTAGPPVYSAITLSWSDATGEVVPDGYLIRGSASGYDAIQAPVDGVPVINGGLNLNVAAGTQQCVITGLSSSTRYYFKIFPYTNAKTDINYKTGGTVPQSSATTGAATGSGEIVISQYYEGTSNNKWIEITNLGPDVDLATHPVYLLMISGGSAKNVTITNPLLCAAMNTGTFASGTSRLVRYTQAVVPNYATADYTNGNLVFNGAYDVVFLSTLSGTTAPLAWNARTDVVGEVIDNLTTGTSIADMSLIRLNSITAGATVYTLSDWTQATLTSVDNAVAGTPERLGYHGFNYFSKPTGNLDDLQNWGTSTDGSGGAPALWSLINQRFTIQNRSAATIGASWTLLGTGTRLIVGDGSTGTTFNNPGFDLYFPELEIKTVSAVTVGNDATITVSGALTNNAGNGGLVIDDGGSLKTEGPVSGGATVSRTISGPAWHQMSAPVTGQTIFLGYTDMYAWDELNYQWLNRNGGDFPDATYLPGKGYLVSWTDTTTKTFTGTLNSGNYTTGSGSVQALTYTPGKGNGFNLLGNPYPSALNGSIDTWTKTNVDNSIWVYNNGTYLTWNGLNGTLTGGIIPAMQGFWVKANATGASLTIPNTARTHSTQSYYKSAEAIQDMILLSVEGNGYKDGIVVNFNDEATEGYDGAFDVLKMYGDAAAPQFFCQAPDKELSIDVLPYTRTRTIPLGLKVGYDNTYTLQVKENTFYPSVSIVLEDLKTGQSIDLQTHPEYTFNAFSSDNTSRFKLHFGGALGVEDPKTTESLSIYTNDNQLCIAAKGRENLAGAVFVYNMIGQLLLQQKLENSPLTRIAVNGPSGYYLVKVVTGQKSFTGKVFIR